MTKRPTPTGDGKSASLERPGIQELPDALWREPRRARTVAGCAMSAEQGWIADPPPPRANTLQRWIERHRALGHYPYPAPNTANPEKWECKCDPDSNWTAVWRILTLEQIKHKFTCMYGGRKRR